jgi:hypothetical protein
MKNMIPNLKSVFFMHIPIFFGQIFIFIAVENLWSLKPKSSLLGVTLVTK